MIKKVLKLGIILIISIFTLPQISSAVNFTNTLRPPMITGPILNPKKAELLRKEAEIERSERGNLMTVLGITFDKNNDRESQVESIRNIRALREKVDDLATKIIVNDRGFYGLLTASDVEWRKIENIVVIFSAKDILGNLSGFTKQCRRWGNVDINIVVDNGAQVEQIELLIKTGFLTRSIKIISKNEILSRDKRYISLTSTGTDLPSGINKYIDFKEGEEYQLISWERVFTALGVAMLGEEPGTDKTSLPSSFIADLTDKTKPVYDIEVAISVKEEDYKAATMLREELKQLPTYSKNLNGAGSYHSLSESL